MVGSPFAPTIPRAARIRLEEYSTDLRRRRMRHLWLLPLITARDIAEIALRRARLFSQLEPNRTPFGYTIRFARQLRPSQSHPHGRGVSGSFDVITLSSGCSLVASALEGDERRQGPLRFVNRSYPYARRPFLTSGELCDLVQDIAGVDGTAISVDAIGYERETHEFRRDAKRQPVDEAAEEMRQQGRDLHRVLTAIRIRDGSTIKVAFDRYASVLLFRGCPLRLAECFILPALQKAAATYAQLSVSAEQTATRQKMVDLQFSEGTFSTRADMEALCSALRRGDGLSVTAVHLNPYLQAQILDFFTGEAVQLVVLNESSASLIPRSRAAQRAMDRIVTTMFRYFGEARIRQARVWQPADVEP